MSENKLPVCTLGIRGLERWRDWFPNRATTSHVQMGVALPSHTPESESPPTRVPSSHRETPRVPTHIRGVVFIRDVDQVGELGVQEVLRRVRVAPCQQPRVGDVGLNREVSGGQRFHCGEGVAGEGLGGATGGSGPMQARRQFRFSVNTTSAAHQWETTQILS